MAGVLILGGGARLYDPGSGTFSPTGTPTGWDGSAILLTNGEVLFDGNAQSAEVLGCAWRARPIATRDEVGRFAAQRYVAISVAYTGPPCSTPT